MQNNLCAQVVSKKDSVIAHKVLSKLDSAATKSGKKISTKPKHTLQKMFYLEPIPDKEIPRIAFMRTVVPGWGQFTNKQYWKVPIVVAAAAGGIWFINDRKKAYDAFKPTLYYLSVNGLTSSTELVEGNEGTLVTYKGKNYRANPNGINYSATALNSNGLQLRKYYNLSYIGFAAGWLLVAVEANVAAHLKSFDVSNNISMKMSPTFIPFGGGLAAGVKLNFDFK